jgi:hypothetical protein
MDMHTEMKALEAQIGQETGAIDALSIRLPELEAQLGAARGVANTAYHDLIGGSATVAQHAEARGHVQTLERAVNDIENDVRARQGRCDEAVSRLTRLRTFESLANKLQISKEHRLRFFEDWYQACRQLEAIFDHLQTSASVYAGARAEFVAEATPFLPQGDHRETKAAAVDLLRELHETTGAPTEEITLSVLGGRIGNSVFTEEGGSWAVPVFSMNLDALNVPEGTKHAVLNGFLAHKSK